MNEKSEPEGIRTPDPRLRRPLLYPAELQTLKRVMGIEPTCPAWKAGVLPLNYTRMIGNVIGVTGFEPAASWSQTRRSSQAELHPVRFCHPIAFALQLSSKRKTDYKTVQQTCQCLFFIFLYFLFFPFLPVRMSFWPPPQRRFAFRSERLF